MDDPENVESLLNDNTDTKHEISIPLLIVENTDSPLVQTPQNQVDDITSTTKLENVNTKVAELEALIESMENEHSTSKDRLCREILSLRK